ncbi:hypothetical protein KR093_001751 [Drosophila rubida]|uniref:Secreted protein n=1 Tax=Drosophila rubida TaxID=30044 RepID=A0AAD4K3N1_9MUSC|nr:hypothetical protein KR093_001751 [Drosophila rubida]
MDVAHNSVGVLGTMAFLFLLSHTTSKVMMKASTPLCQLAGRALNSVGPRHYMKKVLKSAPLRNTCLLFKKTGYGLYTLVEIFATSNVRSMPQIAPMYVRNFNNLMHPHYY